MHRANSFYDAPRETNVWQRMVKILCYDFVTLFYMLVFIFQFVWAIIGHNWLSESGPICEAAAPSATGWDLGLLIVWWVYFGLGIFIALLTVCIQACDEGSCTCENCICGCIMCCTCGLCGKSSVRKGNVHRLADNKQRRENSGWTGTAKKFFGFGCGPEAAERSQGQGPPPTMNQPAHPQAAGYGGYAPSQPQAQYQNQGYAPQPYQPQQYGGQPGYNQGYPAGTQYPPQPGMNYQMGVQQGAKPAPPPQQGKKKGFFSKVKGLFS